MQAHGGGGIGDALRIRRTIPVAPSFPDWGLRRALMNKVRDLARQLA